MLKIIFSILVSFLTLTFSAHSADKSFVSTFSPTNHLNDLNGAVQTIYVDNTGIAWLSTANRVFRYQPYQSAHINSSEESSYEISGVYHIFELDDSLIAATNNDGLFFLDRDLDKFVHIETLDYESISGVMVFSETQFLAISLDGKVHTYTSHVDDDHKISLYRSSTSSCSELTFENCIELLEREFSRTQLTEFHFYTKLGDKKHHYHLSKVADEIKLLQVDFNNKVTLEKDQETIFTYQLPKGIEITSTGLSGRIILLGSHRGLIIIDQKSGTLEIKDESNSRIKSNFVTSILHQANNIFWLGTYSGISFLKVSEVRVIDSESCGLESNDIGGIFISDENIILATYAGLAVAKKEGSSIICPAELIQDIRETRLMNVYRLNDILIFGSRGETITASINNLSNVITPDISWPNKLTGFAKITPSSYVAASMTRGITIISRDGSDMSYFDLSDSAPSWSPIGLPDQLVLFIKEFKVNILDLLDGTQFAATPTSFSDEDFQFLTLSEDKESIIATTLSNHVIIYKYEQDLRTIREKSRFALDTVGYSAILIDHTLVVAQDNGVSIIDLETNAITKKKLTAPSGRYFNFNFGAISKLDENHIVLGATEGAVILPLKNIAPTSPPKLNFTSFAVKGEQMKITAPLHQIQDITLPHDAYHFSAGFAVMDYINPNRSVYKYKLEGLDDEWIDGGYTPSATYTNLSPGEYTLKVKGANSDGVWNNEGISIDIIVKAAPWATWWAYTLYATFAMLGLWLFKRHYDTVQLQIKAVALSREMVEATEGNTETLYHRIERFTQLLSSRDDLFQSVLSDVNTLANESDKSGEPNFAAEHLIKCTSYLHEHLISQRASTTYYISELLHLAFEQYHEAKLANQPKYIPLVDVDDSTLDAHTSVHFYSVLVGILEWLPDNYLTQQVISTAVNVKTTAKESDGLSVQIALGHTLEKPSVLQSDRLLQPLVALGEFSIKADDSNPNQLFIVRA